MVSNSQSPAASPQRRRRQSSVGNIYLGDTAVYALQTMQSRQEARSTQQHQKLEVNETYEKVTDKDLGKKALILLKVFCYRHTWVAPLVILVSSYSLFWLTGNPKAREFLHMFFDLSYEIPNTEPKLYGKGLKDVAFVFNMMIFFTFYREFLMQAVLGPIANYFNITKEAKVKRFVEQTYSMCYYGVTGPWGLYIMSETPIWYFNTTSFYETYPHHTHEYMFKFYYLFQIAFWSQQSVVLCLQLEKPRKDFKELVFHHVITMLLVSCSYRFHFTWIGLAVYITMDISDFFLATSKTLNYLDSPLTGLFFVIFVFIWFYLRHWINIKILWSVLTEFRTVGPYYVNFETGYYKCWISQPIIFLLIFALQLVNLYWFFLILRILARYVSGEAAKDDRSDSEDEDEPDDEREEEEEEEEEEIDEKKVN